MTPMDEWWRLYNLYLRDMKAEDAWRIPPHVFDKMRKLLEMAKCNPEGEGN